MPTPPMLSPATQGILSAASKGLQASGPSMMPRSFGQIMGAAGQAGLNQYGQAGRDQSANAYRNALTQQMQAKQSQQAQQQAMLLQMSANFKKPKSKMLAQAGDIKGAINSEYPDFMENFSKINPKDYDPASLVQFQKTMDPTVLRVRNNPNQLFNDNTGKLNKEYFTAQRELRSAGAARIDAGAKIKESGFKFSNPKAQTLHDLGFTKKAIDMEFADSDYFIKQDDKNNWVLIPKGGGEPKQTGVAAPRSEPKQLTLTQQILVDSGIIKSPNAPTVVQPTPTPKPEQKSMAPKFWTSPKGERYSREDLEHTASTHKISVEEVKKRLSQ